MSVTLHQYTGMCKVQSTIVAGNYSTPNAYDLVRDLVKELSN